MIEGGTFEAKLSTDKWFPVRLVDATDGITEEIGIAHGSVTASYGYEADVGGMTAYAVDATNWKETGNGNYWINMGASEFSSSGKYTIRIAATGCRVVIFNVETRTYTFEEWYTGTNIVDLKLKQLDINNAYGTAMRTRSTGGNGHGFEILGNGSGDGINASSSGSGKGIDAVEIEDIDVIVNAIYGDTAIIESTVGTIDTNVSDIKSTVDTMEPVVNAIYGDTAIIEAAVGTINSKLGTPIDLGDGATIADDLTAMAGKTAGAASYNRLYDSQEALSDAESDNLSVTALKDLLFNRNVTNRHANEKPQIIEAGTGVNLVTVTTTIDGNGNIDTETYA